jgi:hypothetical protein
MRGHARKEFMVDFSGHLVTLQNREKPLLI